MGSWRNFSRSGLRPITCCARWGLLTFGALVGLDASLLEAGTDAPLVNAGGTVALVAGLPGDLDSEKAYLEQIRSWLDLLTSTDKSQRVFVLCDTPDLVDLPAGSSAKILRGDRAGFLGLGEVAAEATNGLTVIVWGHGGRQGSIPVFHVRGPRLMPRDFKTVADRSAGPSHWVLLFRSSGAFARELAGEHRQILSSELDTSFTSDPIGMAVLFRLVAAKPGVALPRLADEFGAAVSAWYAERTLARTEEPTI